MSNSVRNHARRWQIGLPPRDRKILLITRMIQYFDVYARQLNFVWITFSSLFSFNCDI